MEKSISDGHSIEHLASGHQVSALDIHQGISVLEEVSIEAVGGEELFLKKKMGKNKIPS